MIAIFLLREWIGKVILIVIDQPIRDVNKTINPPRCKTILLNAQGEDKRSDALYVQVPMWINLSVFHEKVEHFYSFFRSWSHEEIWYQPTDVFVNQAAHVEPIP